MPRQGVKRRGLMRKVGGSPMFNGRIDEEETRESGTETQQKNWNLRSRRRRQTQKRESSVVLGALEGQTR